MRHSPDARIEPPTRQGPEGLRGPAVRARLRLSAGVALNLAGVLRPVIGLRQGGLRGRALVYGLEETEAAGRRVDPAALNAVDAERLDLGVAERAFTALGPAAAGEDIPLLFLPVTWTTARSERGRLKLLRRVAAAQIEHRCACVCELVGFDEGAPLSVLRDTCGRLTPIFRGVLARIEPSAAAVARLQGGGLSGVSIESSRLEAASDPEVMLRRVLSLQTIGPGVMIHGVRSVAALGAARAAGANWASLDIQPGARDAQGLLAETKTAAREPGPPLSTQSV